MQAKGTCSTFNVNKNIHYILIYLWIFIEMTENGMKYSYLISIISSNWEGRIKQLGSQASLALPGLDWWHNEQLIGLVTDLREAGGLGGGCEGGVKSEFETREAGWGEWVTSHSMFLVSLFANPAVSLVTCSMGQKKRKADKLFSLFGKCYQIWQEECPAPTFLAGRYYFNHMRSRVALTLFCLWGLTGRKREGKGREGRAGSLGDRADKSESEEEEARWTSSTYCMSTT